jgi:hypothetical protein
MQRVKRQCTSSVHVYARACVRTFACVYDLYFEYVWYIYMYIYIYIYIYDMYV